MDSTTARAEIERLELKLAAAQDEDVASALRLKIASLRMEADALPEPAAEAKATPKWKLVPLEPGEEADLRSQLARLEAQADSIEDLDIRDSVDKLIISIHMRLAGHMRVEPLVNSEDLPAATPEQLETAESLLREARVERMRGNRKRADELLSQAADAAPNSAAVLIALADEALSAKQSKKAIELLTRAKQVAPDDPAVERRYGEVVLNSGSGRSIEEQLRHALSEDALIDPDSAYASPKTAAILSFFAPGLGQIVLGLVSRGALIMGFWAAMVFWVFLMRDDVAGLFGMAGIGKQGKQPNMIVLVPIFAALITHIGSVAGCSALGRIGKARPSSERPAPPVNLPFE